MKPTDKMSRVRINLIQQNVYVSESLPAQSVHHSSVPETYPELVQKTVANGIQESIEHIPYPHTPERLKSYVDSTSYKTDLQSAVNAPARGVNLGDVTAMQELSRMGNDQIDALFDRIKEAVKAKNADPQGDSLQNQPQNVPPVGNAAEGGKGE